MPGSGSRRNNKEIPMSVGGSIALFVFCTVFILFGLAFTYALCQFAVYPALRPYFWSAATCSIVTSDIQPSQDRGETKYLFAVTYKYEWDGKEFTSSTVEPNYTGSTSLSETNALASPFQPGTQHTCYTNPASPQESVLRRPFPIAATCGLVISATFVCVGIGLIVIYLRDRRRVQNQDASSKTGAHDQNPLPAYIFCGAFLFVGIACLAFLFIVPVCHMIGASNWTRTPCKVLTSRVQWHNGSRGGTYSVYVLYEYTANGKTYQADRYDFMVGSSSGYDSKQRVVARYPPGGNAFCYVDPTNPVRAVISRRPASQMMFAVIPLCFMMIGAYGIYKTARPGRPKEAPDPLAEGPGLIRCNTVTLEGILVVLFVTLFWNGIVAIFVIELVFGWMNGNANLGLTLFMVPFVCIGLAIFVKFIHLLLAFMNPQVTLTISNQQPHLGDWIDVSWSVRVGVRRVRSLHIYLEGREESDYRKGKTWRTEKSVFENVEVVLTTDRSELQKGSACIEVPATGMYSFNEKDNRVIWEMVVKADMPYYPDVNHRYELKVLPL